MEPHRRTSRPACAVLEEEVLTTSKNSPTLFAARTAGSVCDRKFFLLLPDRSPFQQFGHCLGGQRFRKIISLCIFALQFLQQQNLFNRLYSLADYIQPKILG